MKTKFRYFSLILTLLFGLAQYALCQSLAELESAQKVNDNLNSTSPGNGQFSTVAKDRANAAAAASNSQAGTAPAQPAAPQGKGAAERSGEMAAEPGLGAAEFPGGMNGPMTAVTPTPTPFIEMVDVLAGKRIRCKISSCNAILEDARFEKLPKPLVLSQPDKYFNDGTHGDVDSNDSIWTNIEEDNNWLCPKDNMIKEYLIALLVYVDALSPREFFLLISTTTEVISTVPKDTEEEKLKDEENIRRWVRDFLAQYRTDPNDLRSDFIPIYVPLPPTLPSEPLPAGFANLVKQPAKGAQGSQGGPGGPGILGPGGEFLDGGAGAVSGETAGPGAAQGSYFGK